MGPFIDIGQHGRYAGAGFGDGAGSVHLEGEDTHCIQSVAVITQGLIHSGVAHEGPDHTALALQIISHSTSPPSCIS
ncbi:MAG: hypothetical protein PHV95_05965 [Eubacteriales bacterium]|nr:hypothetical protein [Eubacteriales bacterium]